MNRPRTPHSNHTECFNVFHRAIIQNATTYFRQQSYRMLQHTLHNNDTECYHIFQKAIIRNATTYSRQQSYRMLQYIPDCDHTECYIIFQTACHRAHSRRPGHTTTVDIRTRWEALSLEIRRFLLMKLFSGKKQTYGLRNSLIKCWIIRISELLDIKLKEFCCISIIKNTIRENWK